MDFKKILGVIIEFTPDNVSVDTKSDGKSTVSVPSSTSAPIAPQYFTPVKVSQSEIEKFQKHFQNLFDKSNQPGPDYYEFTKMDDSLSQHVPDERTRFSAVFATLSIQQLTKDKLLASADYYKKIFADANQKFEVALQEKNTTELDMKKKQRTDHEKKIQDHVELIRQLTDEIEISKKSIVDLENQINNEEKSMNDNRNAFMTVSSAVMNKIDEDIKKINNYL